MKCFKNTCFTLDLEVGTFLYDMVPVSATRGVVFQKSLGVLNWFHSDT